VFEALNVEIYFFMLSEGSTLEFSFPLFRIIHYAAEIALTAYSGCAAVLSFCLKVWGCGYLRGCFRLSVNSASAANDASVSPNGSGSGTTKPGIVLGTLLSYSVLLFPMA
jgi:hypothetical protein